MITLEKLKESKALYVQERERVSQHFHQLSGAIFAIEQQLKELESNNQDGIINPDSQGVCDA